MGRVEGVGNEGLNGLNAGLLSDTGALTRLVNKEIRESKVQTIMISSYASTVEGGVGIGLDALSPVGWMLNKLKWITD